MERVHERGTTMVETVLAIGVLLLVLFGIMDFGRLLYTYHMVDNAARIGARFAIVHGASCAHYVTGGGDTWPCPYDQSGNVSTEVANYVSQQSILMGLGPIPTGDVTVSYPIPQVQGCQPVSAGLNSNQGVGCQVAVTVQYTYNFMLPFMPNIPGGIPLTATSKMLISQ